jgi:hypothetical protein
VKVRELIQSLQVLPPESSVAVLCNDPCESVGKLANDVTGARVHQIHSDLVVIDLGCPVTADGSWGTIQEEPHD